MVSIESPLEKIDRVIMELYSIFVVTVYIICISILVSMKQLENSYIDRWPQSLCEL